MLRGARVLDPSQNLDEVRDVLIEGERIAAVAPRIEAEADQVLDLQGYWLMPGLIDIHVHLRDPGFPAKETILSGSRAAVAGGFTSVVAMPNTSPVIDSPEWVNYVLEQGRKAGLARVYTTASMSVGMEGKRLTEMPRLKEAGVVSFTEDGKTLMDPRLVYEAFSKARELELPISSHCEEHQLVDGKGAMHRGWVSEKLGDPGIPALAEELIVARDILFAEETGARLHIQHVSTARAVQLIREAKARGVRVTAEAAPHHFVLTHEAVLTHGPLAKVNPPLRTDEDVAAVLEGLQDGTLDAIATDHAPHTLEEKGVGLAGAPFGLVGMETAVGLVWTHLVHSGRLSPLEVVRKMSTNPARIMGLMGGSLKEGTPADITVIHPHQEWVVDPQQFVSQGKNTPFTGMRLKGKVAYTFVGGRQVYPFTQ